MTTGGAKMNDQHEMCSLRAFLAWCLSPIEEVSQSYRTGLPEGLSVRTEARIALLCPCVDKEHWIELESEKMG